MKHFLITIVLTVASAIGVNAQQVTVDGLHYLLDDVTHEAVVCDFNKWEGELTIPSEICWAGNYTFQLSVSDYTTGTYFLIFSSDNQTKTEKIIINHH